MSKSTFFAKYKDPRWQKKRLEIMERDGFKCTCCHSDEKTLNVHHRWYEKDKDPWDYPNTCYDTLCEDCHDLVKKVKVQINKSINSIHPSAFSIIDGFLEMLSLTLNNANTKTMVGGGIPSTDFYKGISYFLKCDPNKLKRYYVRNKFRVSHQELLDKFGKK